MQAKLLQSDNFRSLEVELDPYSVLIMTYRLLAGAEDVAQAMRDERIRNCEVSFFGENQCFESKAWIVSRGQPFTH